MIPDEGREVMRVFFVTPGCPKETLVAHVKEAFIAIPPVPTELHDELERLQEKLNTAFGVVPKKEGL